MIKQVAHKVALRLEKFADRFARHNSADRVIEPYLGYATQTHIVVRGRVLTAIRRNKPLPHQGVLTNIKQMLSLFFTDEVADVTLKAGDVEGVSDEEGYFQITLPRGSETGWIDVPVSIVGRDHVTSCPVLIARNDAQLMVISDIDDTVLATGAYSLVRNLWASFTGNINTRKVFPDSVALLNALHADGRNPIYYVSSSPWNLFNFLRQIFERNGLVRGPMFLRDLGLSETQFITNGHGSHKGGSIDILLEATDHLPVVLIGDTGQKDAHIYLNAIKNHPERIAAVVLREPGPGADAADHASYDAIKNTGVLLLHGPNFEGFDDQINVKP